MDLYLKDKVIIVTGGAKGIGSGIVKTLSNEDAIPVIIGRDEQDNLKLLSEINQSGKKAFQVVAELTKPDQCEKAINDVIKVFGRIDGLVNNAGVNDGVGLENGNYDLFMNSLQSNLAHYYLMTHHALPYLKISKGAILNISSKTAETGQGGTSGYAAANGGRNALTREWALELSKYSIRVNAIVVAECWTPQYENWIRSRPDASEKLKDIKARIPLDGRLTTVEEIADAVVFLLSERSGHTTGQLIHVDGGYVHLDRGLINN
ncbi:MAG TPA: SDR family oxidoreductase [Flavisolibacter sp.]|nr:SDR family oxidoreductase [Flavisolibacter sp.]